VEAALMYDAVNTVVNAVRQLQRAGSRRLPLANLSCDDLQAWSHGASLYNYINMASRPCPRFATRRFDSFIPSQEQSC